MPCDFQELVDDLRTDGALRDFYIHATSRTDWDAILRRARSSGEAGGFTIDGEPRKLPETFAEIEHLREQASLCWSISVADALVNCHFFCEEEIEFDFRPEDFNTPERWAALGNFFQEIVNLVRKPGIVTHENVADSIIDRFEPKTDGEK